MSTIRMRTFQGFAALLALSLVTPCLAEMRVSQPDAMKAAVKKVQPDYNPIARQMRVQGDVEVEARVSDAGSSSKACRTWRWWRSA